MSAAKWLIANDPHPAYSDWDLRDIPKVTVRIEDAPTPRTYPGGWLVVAVLAAIVALWLPVMILGVVGAVVLGVVSIIRSRAEGAQRG